MVKARELHPIQLDSDLSLENWAERFARQAQLKSVEKLARAVGLIHHLEKADASAADWKGPDAYQFGLEMADILSMMRLGYLHSQCSHYKRNSNKKFCFQFQMNLDDSRF